MNSQSLYEVLGVEPTASTDAIKTAYRELAKRYHPDTHPGHPEYEEVLKDITSAYGVLGNALKRAAYDLGLAPVANDTQSEPENLWEPSPEELRDLYSLDEEARDKEIERLCTLHPHLRQFFDDRPPPPPFTPSASYIAEFKLKERAWRLNEIERQCARHPHLRDWFSKVEAECERAEEERAREFARQRARIAQYESERMVFAGVAFASLGGMVGLIVGFIPCYILGTVFGLFSGAWGTLDRKLNAHEVEVSWFWFLWIVCGVVGAALFFAAQAKERWLESQAQDIVATRVKGILIAVPCLALSIVMITAHADTTSSQGNNLRSRLRAEQIDNARPLAITGVTVDGYYVQPERPMPGAVPASPFPLIAVAYNHAHVDDQMEMLLFQRIVEIGPGQRKGECKSPPLLGQGTWKCQWNRALDPGTYSIVLIHLNNGTRVFLGSFFFVVSAPR